MGVSCFLFPCFVEMAGVVLKPASRPSLTHLAIFLTCPFAYLEAVSTNVPILRWRDRKAHRLPGSAESQNPATPAFHCRRRGSSRPPPARVRVDATERKTRRGTRPPCVSNPGFPASTAGQGRGTARRRGGAGGGVRAPMTTVSPGDERCAALPKFWRGRWSPCPVCSPRFPFRYRASRRPEGSVWLVLCSLLH
ncbi:hypothetical protein VUR80DRAFT_4735 [Thermomyces stellatus]